MKANSLDKFHKTKLGFLIFGIVELAITYGFASLSIDRGNLWWYLLALVFLIGGLQNFIKLMTVSIGLKGKNERKG